MSSTDIVALVICIVPLDQDKEDPYMETHYHKITEECSAVITKMQELFARFHPKDLWNNCLVEWGAEEEDVVRFLPKIVQGMIYSGPDFVDKEEEWWTAPPCPGGHISCILKLLIIEEGDQQDFPMSESEDNNTTTDDD